MSQSEQVNELAKALAKAQSEMPNAPKDARGNFGTFASLAAVRDTVTPHLAKYGLALAQGYDSDERGEYVITTLMHESGQWMKSKLRLQLDKQTMQGFGSASSYGRRYSEAAMVNIAQEDDDAQRSEDERSSSSKGSSFERSPPRAASSAGSAKGAEFRFSFGKFKDRTLTEVPPEELESYVTWVRNEVRKDPKTASKFESLLRAYDQFASNTLEEPPPMGDDDGPF